MKLISILLFITFLFAKCISDTNEKKINIAYVNWSEGIAITHLAKVLLEEQGYKVKLQNADLAPIFASLSRRKADVFLDGWMPATMGHYMQQYGDKIETLGTIYDQAYIGLVVPTYVDVRSIEELNAAKDRFEGKIVGIDAGAGIMQATDKAINDYKLDFKLLTSSGPAMTASLKKAIDRKEWIVVTGWTPHWMFDRFDLRILEDPKKIYGAAEQIQALAWKGFTEKDPFAASLLSHIRLSDLQISSLMAYMEDGNRSETEAAAKWIAENRELVDSWIPERK